MSRLRPALEFISDRPRRALFYLAVAAVLIALTVWPAWVRRRRAPHLAQLRAAADADPEVAAAVADAVPPAVPTARERWLRGDLVLLLAVAVGFATFFLTQDVGRDCRNVRTVVGYIHDHQDLLDPGRIGPGGPDLSEYRAWSDQLAHYSIRVSDPDIARHLQQIGDLSAEAVGTVEQARTPGLSTTGVDVRKAFYLDIVQRLVDADTQMFEACKR